MSTTFSIEDVNLALFPHTNTMVLTTHIDRWDVTKILIDNSSQAEILFLSAFEKWAMTRSSSKSQLSPSTALKARESNPLEL
jgi:predicted hotdog family 3-hydroxylacyl-ACP dehydratase